MNWKKIINYIEDKDIIINNNWYYHFLYKNDINILKNILKDGLKSAYLRGEKKGGIYNGKYFISINKKNNDSESSYSQYSKNHNVCFVLENIRTLHAKFSFDKFYFLCNTIIPIRTSTFDDEYQVFLKIEPSKIIALEYSLYFMTKDEYYFDKNRLVFLKQLILCLKELNINIPIYDYTSNKEINKEKVLSLNI